MQRRFHVLWVTVLVLALSSLWLASSLVDSKHRWSARESYTPSWEQLGPQPGTRTPTAHEDNDDKAVPPPAMKIEAPRTTLAAELVPSVVQAAGWDGDLELDPGSGLQVPRFWQPPAGLDLDAHVPQVDGQPTILLLFSSYRDFQCRESVASAFSRATHASRVGAAIVDQVADADLRCDEPPLPCEQDRSQPLCAHATRIRAFRVEARHGTGPTFARHLSHRMYRGEAFVFQVFVRPP